MKQWSWRSWRDSQGIDVVCPVLQTPRMRPHQWECSSHSSCHPPPHLKTARFGGRARFCKRLVGLHGYGTATPSTSSMARYVKEGLMNWLTTANPIVCLVWKLNFHNYSCCSNLWWSWVEVGLICFPFIVLYWMQQVPKCEILTLDTCELNAP